MGAPHAIINTCVTFQTEGRQFEGAQGKCGEGVSERVRAGERV